MTESKAIGQGRPRRQRRRTLAVLESLEDRTLLTLSATITGTTSTFQDLAAPLGGTLQVPSPTTPITTNLTNNQFEAGNAAFVDAFDFDSVAPGSNPLAAAVGSTVALSVAGNAANYTFHIGPSSAPLLAGFQFTGGTGNNTMILDFASGNPIAGGAGVSFGAASGTNVLRILDPLGTNTTATYDVSTHELTFAGEIIDVSAANLTIDLTGTKVAALTIANSLATPGLGGSYDLATRTFQILAGGPSIKLPVAPGVPNESINLTGAGLNGVAIVGAAPAIPATYTFPALGNNATLGLNGGVDTVTFPFATTPVNLAGAAISTLTVDSQPGFNGLTGGYRLMRTGVGTVAGIHDGAAASPFLTYDTATSANLVLRTGALTGRTLAVDATNGNPLPAAAAFDAALSVPSGALTAQGGAFTSVAVDYAAQTVVFNGTSTVTLTNVPTIDLAGTGATVASLAVNLPNTANVLTMIRDTAAPTSPVRLTRGASTLLYPAATSPVTLTGGNVSNALTVDLANGNPLPPDTGPGSGLVLNTTVATTVAFRNGIVNTATLDMAAFTLKLDNGLIRFPAFTPIDLTAIGVVNAVLVFSATRHNVILEQTATGAQPFRFYEAPNVALFTFGATTSTASAVGAVGQPNVLTVDYTQGNPVPTGGLTFDGQANGTLIVSGTGANANLESVAYTATAAGAGRLVIDSGTAAVPEVRAIGFTGLTPLFVTTPAINTVSVDIVPAVTGTLVNATVEAVPVVPPTPAQDRVSLNLGLESITYTHPANLILSATGGDPTNTYQYSLHGFTNNVTVDGNAGTLIVNASRDAAGNPNAGTLTVHGAQGNATLNVDATHGDPIPAAGGVSFYGGLARNSVAVVNPPTPNPLILTTVTLFGPSAANLLTLGLGGGTLRAVGLNNPDGPIDLTGGVTSTINVQFANTVNAIDLKTVVGGSLIGLNGSPLLKFNPANATTVNLNGGTGDDSLTINFAAGNPLPATFGFNGGTGKNTLIVTGATVTAAAVNDAPPSSVTLDALTIPFSDVQTIDLSGSTVAKLDLNLAAAPATVTLSRTLPLGTSQLTYGAGSRLLYPFAANPVAINGGASTNAMTIDLGNGNPVPPGTDPTKGLFVNLVGDTNFQVVNGQASLVTLDRAAKTLAIDTGLVLFAALPRVDLRGTTVSTLELGLAGDATLQRETSGLPTLQFLVGGAPILDFADTTPIVKVIGAAGPNILTIDYVHGSPLPAVRLVFDGSLPGAANVAVVRNATLNTAAYAVGSSNVNSLWLDTGRVELINPSKTAIVSSTLDNLDVYLADTPNAVAFDLEAGSGLNRIGLGAATLLAFATPSGATTVGGGNQGDSYRVFPGFASKLVIRDDVVNPDSGGVNVNRNTLWFDFGGNPAILPTAGVTYHGSGNDAIATDHGGVNQAAYAATGPGSGTIAFNGGLPVAFTGLQGDASGVNLSNAALGSLTVTVADGVAHAYTLRRDNAVQQNYLAIDRGVTGVLFPSNTSSLALNAGAGDDQFNVGEGGIVGNLAIDGGGGDDTLFLRPSLGGLIETAVSASGRTGLIAGSGFLVTLSGAGVPNVFGLSFHVTNDHDAGLGSLRAAILNANLYPGHTIDSDARYTIAPETALPALASQSTIAGGWMTVDGRNRIANGLQVVAGGNGATIQGLTLINFSNAGLFLNQANGVRISGIVAYSNGTGVLIQGSGNLLTGQSLIGYNPDADARGQAMPSPFGNKGYGVVILGGSNNRIGADNLNERQFDNVISGNGLAGVGIVAAITGAVAATPTGNVVQNNVLGLDRSQQFEVGNLYGVYLEGAGTNTIQRNAIAGNGRFGIYLVQSSNVKLANNQIGRSEGQRRNQDGRFARGNFGDGIFVSDSSDTLITGNAIANNFYPNTNTNQVFANPPFPRPNSRRAYRQSFLANGIHLAGRGTRGTRIVNNKIGLTRSGQVLPNQAFPILISSGASYRSIVGNAFRTNPRFAPETTIEVHNRP